jgi:hypothetical protein
MDESSQLVLLNPYPATTLIREQKVQQHNKRIARLSIMIYLLAMQDR